ncbi:MAG: homoserine dehydrogenase, partial [Spirochaetia bacterium]|nr:homoserine dehydrogenase [Spirochaetia bacterium]
MSSSESPEIPIGLVGLGVVGSGLVQLLETHSKTLEKRSGLRFRIKTICSRTFANKARLKLSRYHKTKKWQDVVADPEIKIVVELIGGTDTAYELIQAALKNGKHVVTANKAVLAKHGPKLFELAIKHRVELFYEAAIGGGIPIVKIFKESLIGNRINEFYAIINGTTNFILSQMVLKEAGFGEALRKAQELGFA